MKNSERIFNWLFGLSILSWAIAGLVNSELARPISVTISIAALHLVVGTLVITRQSVHQHGSIQACIMATPAVLIGGISVHDSIVWNTAAQLILTGGTMIAITSFLYLGKSFAILPAKRNIVVSGPYRLVRHPAYLGELIMLIGCTAGSTVLWGLLGIALALVLLAVRIIAEENLLATDPRYQQYQTTVRYRLIPGIW